MSMNLRHAAALLLSVLVGELAGVTFADATLHARVYDCDQKLPGKLVGWILLTPQMNPDFRTYDTSLALWKWRMTGPPVASKQDCEQRRRRSFKLMDDPAIRNQVEEYPQLRTEVAREQPSLKFPTEKEYFDYLRKAFELSQCVSGDDPRLKGN